VGRWSMSSCLEKSVFGYTALLRELSMVSGCPDGTGKVAPKGGVILRVQLEVDRMEVFHEARRNRIFVLLPGIISSGADQYKNCIRISCGNPWSERIEKGIQPLGEIVGRMAR
jgi:DNA-binding transcriptional MocR family regulator